MSQEHFISYEQAVFGQDGKVDHFERVREEVIPLTEHALASLPPDEREESVRTQLLYQRPFAKSFIGVDENIETKSATTHLAQLILDFEARSYAVSFNRNTLATEEQRYTEDKKRFKGKQYHVRVKDWSQEKQRLVQQVKDSETLQGESIDIFLMDFITSPNGIDNLLLALEEIKETAPENVARVEPLLDLATERLGRNENSFRARKLSYLDKDALPQSEDLQALSRLIGYAFQDRDNSELDERLKELSSSLIDFYWKNSGQLYKENAGIHYLRLMHDVLFASSISKDPRLFIDVVDSMTEMAKKKAKEYKSQEAKLVESHSQVLSSQLNPRRAIEYVVKELVQGERDTDAGKFNINSPSIILMSLASAGRVYHTLAQKKADFLSSAKVSVLTTNPNENLLGDLMVIYYGWLHENDTLWSHARSMLSSDEYENVYHVTTEERLRLWSHRYHSAETNIFDEDALIFSLYQEAKEAGDQDATSTHKSLREQYSQIRDDYKYFVALCGDRFQAEDDYELRESQIRQITFRPLKSKPLSHQVDLNIALPYGLKNKNVTLCISESGDYLLANGKPTTMPLFIKNKLSKIILPRLEYITSGEAFDKQEQVGVGEALQQKQEKVVLARRSHWRKLPGDRYALESPQAQEHIIQVYEDYGISTWEEILRRRVEGTLAQNEVMTYVRGFAKEGSEPNIIVYKPKNSSEK